MLLEAERAKRPRRINGENLLRRLIREKSNSDGDQPANEVRVAVAAVVKGRHAGGVDPRLFFKPDLADAPAHLVRVIMRGLAQGLEAVAEFDQIAVAVLPLVKGGEIFANRLKHSHCNIPSLLYRDEEGSKARAVSDQPVSYPQALK